MSDIETASVMKAQMPILYSFRRCPYAIRARLGLASAGIGYVLREVVLRDKPADMLKVSPKGTVPVLVLPDGQVIDESLDIMKWALEEQDPEGLYTLSDAQYEKVDALIVRNDTVFKASLDRYKYPGRFEGEDPLEHREKASEILRELDGMLAGNLWLLGDYPTLADMALLPFVRQFSFVDREWFLGEPWPELVRWLEDFLESERFQAVMAKNSPWKPGDEPLFMPG